MKKSQKIFIRVLLAAAVAIPTLYSTSNVSASVVSPKAGAACDKAGDANGVLFCESKSGKLVWADNQLKPGIYKIGVENLLSGPSAFAGVPMSKGMRRAVDEINESGFLGKGAKLQVIERDSAGSIATALGAINEFAAEKVSGIICCSLSSMAAAIGKVAEEKKIPIVIEAAVLPGLTRPPYITRTVFMTGATNGIQWQSAQLMAKAIGAKSAAIPVNNDNQGMAGDGVMYTAALKAAGVTTILDIKTPATDTDVTGVASQIIAANPDMVIPAMLGGPASRLVKALRDRGYKGRIVGNYGLSDQTNFAIAGASLAGVMMPVFFYAEAPVNKASKDLIKWWKLNNNGQLPSAYPPMGYTATYYLATAIKNSGDGSSENVAKALQKIGRMETVFGQVKFTDGQLAAAKSGKPTFITWTESGKQVVWNGK